MLASDRFGKALHSRDLAKYRVARRGTIVADPMLLWDGSIGRQEVVDAGLVSPDYRVYELADHVCSDFMRYVVRNPSMLRNYQGGARGTNVRRNRIARGDFLRIPFRLPPVPEQRKIAAILSAVDEVIAKIEAVIESLQTLKKSMMQELLTRGLPGRHTRFKQTEIGEMPEDWLVVRLADLSDGGAGLQTGPFGSQLKASEYAEEGVPVVMPKDLVGLGISEQSIVRVPRTKAREMEKHSLLPGDILFARRGEIGRCGLVGSKEAGWLCGTGCLRARVAINRAEARYLVRVIDGPLSRAWLTERAVGQTMLNLNTAILGGLPLPLPSLGEQREITAAVESIELRVAREAVALDNSSALKSGLMSVLLAGELRVPPDEGAA
jgi:type I restriction enzyme S subunit